MAEPFSLGVNVIQIISACTSTIKTIDHLIQNFTDAGVKLKSLAAKASLVRATLNELEKLLKGRESAFAKRIDHDLDLKSAIDQTLTGCWTVFLLLQKELGKWHKDGKDPSFLKKAGLIFQDEIIQDYRIQIEGHVEGLKTVLVCLQAQTVTETHETLKRANATLERIANATVNIRQKHKEIAFPESVYEGYTTYEEDKPFDKELLNSSAYRAAFNKARKTSLLDGDASMMTMSTGARKDFLSDQPVDEERVTLRGSNDLLGSDVIEDLISFDNNPNWKDHSATSPNAQLMEGLTWESHILDGDNASLKAPVIAQPVEDTMRNGSVGEEVQIDDLLDDMLQDAAKRGVHPDNDRGPRRDSAHPTSNRSSAKGPQRTARSSMPTVNQKNDASSVRTHITILQTPDEEGLIPCSTEPESALGRSMSISTAGSRRFSSPTLGYFNLSPMSPTSEQPGITALPLDHRLSNPQDHTPKADEHTQESLSAAMYHVIRSLDPTMQLDWAENVLDHLSITVAHEMRLASLNVRQKSAPAPLSESERTLQSEATQLVDTLTKAGYGRAYFLSAKYLALENEREHLHLLAIGQRYTRSHYYLGQMAETGEVVGDPLKRYRAGEAYGDAACLNRLSRAHMAGQMGIKKNKDEGLRLLREAAKSADRDCPEPLYDLAMLHLAREQSNPLRLTSKPLVERNVPEAFLLLRRAALLGHGPSQLRIGQVHRTGFFDAKEAKKAEQSIGKLTRSSSSKWIRRTSSQTSSSPPGSSTDAEINPTLAMHYLHLAARRGLPQADYEIAHEMLFKSGELSPQYQRLAYAHTARALLGDAQFANGLMGKILEDGIGCKVNLKQAGEYYFKGRQEGDEWARKRLEYLLNEKEGVSAGTSDTYKKPTSADQKEAARRS